MPTSHAQVAIVGAGFSGIATAVHLLRRVRRPMRIVLINRTHRFGRGLAYGTPSNSHLLNVPVGRMSLFSEEPADFLGFLTSRGMQCSAGDFVRRSSYGEYLEAAIEQARQQSASGAALDMMQAEVKAIEAPPGKPALLLMSDGSQLQVEHVVMAWGNFAPRMPMQVGPQEYECLVRDPWKSGALDRIPRRGRVLLLGSGLTAFDVALSLLDRGHQGPIAMLSRRGLLPQPHRRNEHPPSTDVVASNVFANVGSAGDYVHGLRSLLKEAHRAGLDWRDVIAGLRPHTPRLWRQLDLRGRRQLLRHALPHWETHRHRAAPEVSERIREAMAQGRLTVAAGRLNRLEPAPTRGFLVHWEPRGQAHAKSEEFDAVVNCTGPSSDLRLVNEPLVRQMHQDGSLKIDPLRLGLEVDSEYRMLRADGTAMERVRYIGPLLKAELWEATAVPELRAHAQALADMLASQMGA